MVAPAQGLPRAGTGVSGPPFDWVVGDQLNKSAEALATQIIANSIHLMSF